MAMSPLKKTVSLLPASDCFEGDYFQSPQQSKRRGDLGQIAIEYVLILFVAVTMAVLVSKELVSRDPQDPGHIVKAWVNILQTIGSDIADAPAR